MPGAHLIICRAGRSGVAGCRECTGNLSVGIASLDDHASKIKVVLRYELTGLVDSHSLFLTQLSEELSILLSLWIVQRVDNSSLVDVLQSPLLSELVDIFGVADEDEVCEVIT